MSIGKYFYLRIPLSNHSLGKWSENSWGGCYTATPLAAKYNYFIICILSASHRTQSNLHHWETSIIYKTLSNLILFKPNRMAIGLICCFHSCLPLEKQWLETQSVLTQGWASHLISWLHVQSPLPCSHCPPRGSLQSSRAPSFCWYSWAHSCAFHNSPEDTPHSTMASS